MSVLGDFFATRYAMRSIRFSYHILCPSKFVTIWGISNEYMCFLWILLTIQSLFLFFHQFFFVPSTSTHIYLFLILMLFWWHLYVEKIKKKYTYNMCELIAMHFDLSQIGYVYFIFRVKEFAPFQTFHIIIWITTTEKFQLNFNLWAKRFLIKNARMFACKL